MRARRAEKARHRLSLCTRLMEATSASAQPVLWKRRAIELYSSPSASKSTRAYFAPFSGSSVAPRRRPTPSRRQYPGFATAGRGALWRACNDWTCCASSCFSASNFVSSCVFVRSDSSVGASTTTSSSTCCLGFFLLPRGGAGVSLTNTTSSSESSSALFLGGGGGGGGGFSRFLFGAGFTATISISSSSSSSCVSGISITSTILCLLFSPAEDQRQHLAF
mmetsp:Transcript_23354/g.71839  ORF Transcript_23354/g.71839 Transcript_23354/m.71839 type:complete len:221 (+) Transcript_23354:314-976(+)